MGAFRGSAFASMLMLWLLCLWSLWLPAQPDDVAARAQGYLDAVGVAIKQAILQDRPEQARYRLMSDPVVRAATVWKGGTRVFPSGQGLPHIGDDPVRHESPRLASLLQTADPVAWERYDVAASALLYCRRDAMSVCLLIDTQALRTALSVSEAELLGGIFGRPAGRASLGSMGLLVLPLTALLVWRFRRGRAAPPSLGRGDVFIMGDMQVDVRSRRVRRGGLLAGISERDLKLLRLLHAHPDEVLSKHALYVAAWGRPFLPGSRALEQHILMLRRKLDPDGHRLPLIETVHGQGYRFPSGRC